MTSLNPPTFQIHPIGDMLARSPEGASLERFRHVGATGVFLISHRIRVEYDDEIQDLIAARDSRPFTGFRAWKREVSKFVLVNFFIGHRLGPWCSPVTVASSAIWPDNTGVDKYAIGPNIPLIDDLRQSSKHSSSCVFTAKPP
jgi:hypothetical protein